jgi:hypothetical protein
VDREREQKVLLLLVGDLVVRQLDDEDLVTVTGVALLVRADVVRAGTHGLLGPEVLREGEDGDPAGVQLLEVLEAVLVLAEPRRGIGQVLHVVHAALDLGEHAAPTEIERRSALETVGADRSCQRGNGRPRHEGQGDGRYDGRTEQLEHASSSRRAGGRAQPARRHEVESSALGAGVLPDGPAEKA